MQQFKNALVLFLVPVIQDQNGFSGFLQRLKEWLQIGKEMQISKKGDLFCPAAGINQLLKRNVSFFRDGKFRWIVRRRIVSPAVIFERTQKFFLALKSAGRKKPVK